jgi:hypothetical protein
MDLQVNFYSKTDVAINLVYDPNYYETPTNDLFIYTCFALRQFKNLGQHVVAQALAGLLISGEFLGYWSLGNQSVPDGPGLLASAEVHKLIILGADPNNSELKFLKWGIKYRHDPVAKILTSEYLANKPSIVQYQGDGSKRFFVSYPPFQFHPKGFGLFGAQVNYYAFQSVLALYKFIDKKYSGIGSMGRNLKFVCHECADAYLRGTISLDQPSLARQIIQNL